MTWDAVLTFNVFHDYKPSDHIDQSALELLSTKLKETATVIAHARDLTAASKKSVSVFDRAQCLTGLCSSFGTFYIVQPTDGV